MMEILKDMGVSCNFQWPIQLEFKKWAIIDFYVSEDKLAIEVDGKYHNIRYQKNQDRHRQNLLRKSGIRLIRFSNREVLNQEDFVRKRIFFSTTQKKNFDLTPIVVAPKEVPNG